MGRYDMSSQFGNPAASAQPYVDTPDEQKRRRQADFMHFLGSIAPAAGSVLGGIGGGLIGGPAGIVAGAGIGGGIGQMAGSGLDFAGSQETQGDDIKRQQQQQRRQDLFAALGAMRGL